jgi:hypothetical protein
MKSSLIAIALIGLSLQGPSEDDKPQLNLYQRKREPIDSVSKLVSLYIGLEPSTYLNSLKVNFKLDFNYDKIIVQNSVKCENIGHCILQNKGETQNGSYHQQPIKFQTGVTFLNFYELSAAEVPDKETANILLISTIQFLAEPSDSIGNIVGLSPNSKIWEDWNNIFYFRNQIFNITYSNYPDRKFVRYYSAVSNEVALTESSKSSPQYKFKGKFNLSDNSADSIFCLDTSDDLTFRLDDNLYDKLIKEICKDGSKCTTKADLKSEINSDLLSFIFSDFKNANKIFKAQINQSSIFELDKLDNLLFHFDKITNIEQKECDVSIGNRFFEKYYLIISNDLANKDVIYVGFDTISSLDFMFLNLWKYLLTGILIVSIAVLLFGALKRFAAQNSKSKDAENYDNLSQLESFKKKPLMA